MNPLQKIIDEVIADHTSEPFNEKLSAAISREIEVQVALNYGMFIDGKVKVNYSDDGIEVILPPDIVKEINEE